jgi:hypothetical protein
MNGSQPNDPFPGRLRVPSYHITYEEFERQLDNWKLDVD